MSNLIHSLQFKQIKARYAMKNIVSQEDVLKAIDRTNECMRLLMKAGLSEIEKQAVLDDPKLRKAVIDFWRKSCEKIKVFEIEPLSLINLAEMHGQGVPGFHKDADLDGEHATDVPKAGRYEINFGENLNKLSDSEQLMSVPANWSFPHPSVLSQAIFQHWQETGEHLLENWYSRTSFDKLLVGRFHPKPGTGEFKYPGLDVQNCYHINHAWRTGIALMRKIA